MRLTVRVLGREVLTIDTDRDDRQSPPDRGDCTTEAVGFVASYDMPEESGLPRRIAWE